MEPLTIIAAAKLCANSVKQIKNLCDQGAELHQMGKQLSDFFSAKQDIEKQHEELQNPPVWKKVLAPGSTQAMAIDAVIQRKRTQELMMELHRTLKFRGIDWSEVVAEKKAIEAMRQKQIYARKEIIRKWTEGALIIFATFLTFGLIILFIYIFSKRDK
ncbi:hypothetical protein [Pseudoalteromonas lipolytica]|uniref:hypothetical protein n=1 Tax=Pseudoalteromonas lipolytica TaxID=570156 RepID=UPI00241DAC2D|nr:hypothetical protein [Pseudoalteromonas lipolytica]|tara:strand:- start:2091 stop:2567 length:477 start_codon:yes stop_codon:yes gene_type:complete